MTPFLRSSQRKPLSALLALSLITVSLGGCAKTVPADAPVRIGYSA